MGILPDSSRLAKLARVGRRMQSLSLTALAVLFAAIITLAVGVSLRLPLGEGLEGWMGDRMQLWRYELRKEIAPAETPDRRLILVGLDQKTVNDLGRLPLPRDFDAQFLGVLSATQPKVVGWDILFTERTAQAATANASAQAPGTALAPDDEALVEGAKLVPHMVTAAYRDPDGLDLRVAHTLPTRPFKNIRGDLSELGSFPLAVIPYAQLRAVSYFGFADAPGKDERRIMPLVLNVGGQIFPSLSLQVLMQYWGVDPDQVVIDLGHEITLPRGDGTMAHIPIDRAGRFLVNYRGREEDFQESSFSWMGKGLADLAAGKSSQERAALPTLKDSIVMIGATLQGADDGPIPIDAYSPLVVAHLNVLNDILKQDYLHTMSLLLWMPIYFVYLFVIGNTMLRVGFSPMIPIGALALLLGVATAFAALLLANLLVPVLLPEIGILALAGVIPTQRFFGEEREKKRVKSAMRAYLSDKVMTKVLEHPDNLKLGGVKQEITIMFCDIRGFTAYCDERDPAETMDVLNAYMEVMTQVVFRHDGTIDKYIGDCIMAFWNAPELQPQHADMAVRCAMEMRHALVEFKAGRPRHDLDGFECGIGIHTGEALVGNMGSSLKRNYTAMGSTVNLGSRLETLTKKLGEPILISQDVVDHLHGDYPLLDRGEAEVAGVSRPVHVYGVRVEKEGVPTPDATAVKVT
jgi:adenylate cyclase